MTDSKPPSSTLEVNVPTYIPLSEAAQQHGLSEQALTQLRYSNRKPLIIQPGDKAIDLDDIWRKNAKHALDSRPPGSKFPPGGNRKQP